MDNLLAMKVMLRSSSGKSLVLDVSPTDTFVDLQARTLRETGCLLDLQHFKYKGKEIKAENNVMKCFQDELSRSKVEDGPAISNEVKFSKEPLSASDSVKLSNSDSAHILHKNLLVKVSRKQKSSKKFSRHLKRLIFYRKEKHLNVAKTVDISAKKAVVNSPVTNLSVVCGNENRGKCCVEAMESLGSLKSSKEAEQKMDGKDELKVEDMDSICMNDQQKSNDSVYVEYKNIQNIASNSDRTPGSKRDPGRDMLQQNYLKQNESQVSRIEDCIETDKYKIPAESVDTTTCCRNLGYISEPAKKEPQKDTVCGSDNFVNCALFRGESHCIDGISACVGKHKPKQKPEDLNLRSSKYELEPPYADGSTVSCSKKEEEKTCVENSYVYCKPVRASSEVNLTTPNVLKMLESTDMDKDMLSRTTVSAVDMVTVTNIRPKTVTSNTMYCGEGHPNTAEISEMQLAHPDAIGDSGYCGQLCRLCALPRQTMVYIFSEIGLQLGLRSKINTWLPTHVSRTDPLPKQVCDFCIEKLDLCQDFGTSCMKAEQTLSQLFENGKFRCHFRICGEPGASCSRSGTTEENADQRLTSKCNQLLGSNEQSGCISKSVMRSDFFPVSRTADLHDFKINSIMSHTLSSEDEESDYLISEDSSEHELVDMILGDDCYEGDKVIMPTNYCCPLCCEGSMVTVKQIHKDTPCSSKRSLTDDLDTGADIEGMNQLSVKKHTDTSDNSSLKMFTYPHIQYINNDYGSSYEDDPVEQSSNLEVDGDSNSNSIMLSIASIKEEDNYNLEGATTSDDRGGGKREGVITISAKQGHVNVKSERTEDNNPVSCFLCGETVINLNQCLVHALCAHADSETHSYQCSLCERCFSVDTDLTRHFMNIHQNIKDARLLHVCIVCGRHCASQRALKSHVCIPVNSVPDQLACKICGQSFSTKARLVFHHQFHDPNARSLECIPCGMVFTEEDNLYDHIRFTHQGRSFICNECGGHFNSKAALRGHMRSHRNLRHHKCEICSKTFLDKQTLKEHSVCHMEVKPFQCHICGKYLNRNSRLKKHLMSHELQKTADPQECFHCAVCGETFPNEPKAIAHAQIGHSLPGESECVFQLFPVDKVYRCEFCERFYADPSFLSAHRSNHTDEPLPFKCHICGAGFATFARVATHKVTHGVYEKKDEFSVPKLYLCDSCDKAYVHWTYLSVHRKMIHAEVKHMYKCKMCPEQFINSWSLAYHRKTRHSLTEPPLLDSGLPASERKRWKCEYCEKRYVSQQSLLAHVNMLHTGDNPGPTFQCDQCGKRLTRKSSLDSHKKTHSGTKPHVCPLCKKTFLHSSGLSSHLRLHRGDKPHSCKYCGKKFLQRGDRDDHVRKHTGEKPFSCPHCPKSFRTRAMWFEHTRIHRDERPFPCDICGSAFRRSYALKNHKTIHTGERPHVCEICNRAFRQKQDMQKHVRSHHQEKIQVQELSDEVMTFVLPTD